MADCTTLNGIQRNCSTFKSGIRYVWIFNFNDVSEYRYTNDDLNFVTAYSANTLPTEYKPNRASNYIGNHSLGSTQMYDHELNLVFSKIDEIKRADVQNLEHMDLTIIFKDENDICWLMGQEYPVRLNKSTVKTNDTGYELQFTSREKEQLKRIECPSVGCFVSFKATPLYKCEFEVTLASTLVWEELEIAGNNNQATLNPTFPFNPTNWTTPATYNRDYYQFGLLLNAVGDYTDYNMSYDSGDDAVNIIIWSETTNFGALRVDDDTYSSSVNVTVNFNTVVSAPIANNSTLIEFSDSNGVVWTSGYSETLTEVGYSGTTNDFTLDADVLYPTGTTFYIELTNQPCSALIYDFYFQGSLSTCSLSKSFDFYKGKRIKMVLPYTTYDVNTPKFQNIQLNIYGYIINMYMQPDEWHSSFVQFQNDITYQINSLNIPLDYGSLVITDHTTYAEIEFFIVGVDNTFHKSWTTGYQTTFQGQFGYWNSRLLNLQTSAPYPSVITITDQYANQIEGENNVNITSNDFTLESNGISSNTSVDNVNFQWSFDNNDIYSEISYLTIGSVSDDCLVGDINFDVEKCFSNWQSSTTKNYQLLTLNTSGDVTELGADFEFEYNQNGTLMLSEFHLPNSVTPENFSFLSEAFNGIRGVHILHMEYKPTDRIYEFHLIFDTTFTPLTFTETTNMRSFSLSSVEQVHTNTVSSLNPYIELDWTLPTISGSFATGFHPMKYGIYYNELSGTTMLSAEFNLTGDSLEFTTSFTGNTYYVGLHEEYPTVDNHFALYEMPDTDINLTYTGITADLISSGSTLGDINFISCTNHLGWLYVLPIALVGDSTSNFFEFYRNPILWGTPDNINYRGSQTMVAPSILSTFCLSDCCDSGTIPVSGNTDSLYTWIGIPDFWDLEVTFNVDVACNIVTGTCQLTPELGSPAVDSGNPINLTNFGCVAGIHTFRSANPVNFTGNPTGFTYEQKFEWFDLYGQLLWSYTKSVTF